LIDIHVIDSGKFPENLQLVKAALVHPLVTLHTVSYQAPILKARATGYAQGTAPYVSSVDDDDAVLDTSWFEEAIRLLDTHPDISCVYAQERVTCEGNLAYTTSGNPWTLEEHKRTPALLHHLVVMRRPYVETSLAKLQLSLLPLSKDVDSALFTSMMRYGRPHCLPVVAYEWRVRERSARTIVNTPAISTFIRKFNDESYRQGERWNAS
jgi:hypothetical protein